MQTERRLMDEHIGKILIALAAATPGLYALFTKRKAMIERTATNQFNLLYEAQSKLVANCQQRCSDLESELRRTWDEYRKEIQAIRREHEAEVAAIRQEHATQVAAFQQKHRIELDDWQKRYLELEGIERGHEERLEYLEQLLRRSGIIGRDSGGHPQQKGD